MREERKRDREVEGRREKGEKKTERQKRKKKLQKGERFLLGVIYQNKMIIYVVLARYYREGKRRGAFFYNDVSRKKEDESEGKKWREEGERKESAGRRQIFSTTTLSHSTFTFLSFFPLRLARSLNFSFSLSFSLEKAGEASQEETKRKRL